MKNSGQEEGEEIKEQIERVCSPDKIAARLRDPVQRRTAISEFTQRRSHTPYSIISTLALKASTRAGKDKLCLEE